MAPWAKFSLHLKIMGLQKLGLGLINQFQMAMILEAFVKVIMVSFVPVIHFICWMFLWLHIGLLYAIFVFKIH